MTIYTEEDIGHEPVFLTDNEIRQLLALFIGPYIDVERITILNVDKAFDDPAEEVVSEIEFSSDEDIRLFLKIGASYNDDTELFRKARASIKKVCFERTRREMETRYKK